MKFWRSLVSINGSDSSKNFTLIVSAIVSAIVGVCVCFVLCWDVVHNGYVKTDMESMGIFMLCMGGYLAGGSVTKLMSVRIRGRHPRVSEYIDDTCGGEYTDFSQREDEEPCFSDDEPYDHRPRKRKRRSSDGDNKDKVNEDGIA